mgnify:CR=1 FL=1
MILKNACTVPIVLLFVCTTNPSEFAASLNRIGVSYKISYAVSLALRYIPDIQREYRDISLAQQARGTEMSKKNSIDIICPLYNAKNYIEGLHPVRSQHIINRLHEYVSLDETALSIAKIASASPFARRRLCSASASAST